MPALVDTTIRLLSQEPLAGRVETSRLLELADIPPDYLKVDKALIRDIDLAAPRQAVVAALLTAVSKFGVRVIAEGIETEAVAAICLQLGCEFGQGYLFGRPA